MSVSAVKMRLTHEIELLNENELLQVAEYVAFLRHRGRVAALRKFDTTQLAALYAEYAEEDRALAEANLDEYVKQLALEDQA
jgi:hypothetical protein